MYHEANFAADWMASFAATFPVGTHILQQAPLGIGTWLKHDYIGVVYPKNVIC